MTLDALIMFTGAFVALLPFLGFPNSWDTVLLVLAGVLIIALGIVVRRRLGRLSRRAMLEGAEKLPQRPIAFSERDAQDENELAQ